jgi:hypothetical protein
VHRTFISTRKCSKCPSAEFSNVKTATQIISSIQMYQYNIIVAVSAATTTTVLTPIVTIHSFFK